MITPEPERMVDFDSFPMPARHLLPNHLYAEFPTERRNFTVLVSSLGCPRRCLFCEAGGTPHNSRSPATVVAEMEECHRRHAIREVDIFDYEFPCNRSRTLEICRGLREKKTGPDMGVPLEGRLRRRGSPEGDGGRGLQEDLLRP